MAMDNPRSVVTVERLQTFLDKLKTLFVKSGSDASLNSVEIGDAVTVSASTSGDESVISIASPRDTGLTVKLDGEEERTVATCEDTAQTIKALLHK